MVTMEIAGTLLRLQSAAELVVRSHLKVCVGMAMKEILQLMISV